MYQGDEQHYAEAHDQFSLWCATPLGGQLLDAEHQALHQLADGLHGRCIVQLGRLAGRDLVSGLGMGKPIILLLSATRGSEPGSLHCTPDCLPLACDSVDMVLAPHCLEFSASPRQLLAEMARVILPGGHLVLIGFNPISLWGLTRMLHFGRGRMPWRGRYLSSLRVRHYLGQLNLDILSTHHACYRLPSQTLYQRTAALEAIGGLCWPPCGAVHLMLAQKRVLPVTPLRLRWRERRRRAVTSGAVVTLSVPIVSNERRAATSGAVPCQLGTDSSAEDRRASSGTMKTVATISDGCFSPCEHQGTRQAAL